jgi:hypothetical protein
MGTMLKRFEKLNADGVFDEEKVRILSVAFESAWQAIEESGANFTSAGLVEATRELLALRIIEVAKASDVRDHVHLRDDALLYLAQSSRRSSGC